MKNDKLLRNVLNSPQIKRDVAADKEKTKTENDIGHPMHGVKPPKYRLKSRESLIKISTATDSLASEERIERWKQTMLNVRESLETEPKELHKGKTLPWSLRRTINGIKAACKCTKNKMHKWGLAENVSASAEFRTKDTFLSVLILMLKRRANDVREMNDNDIRLAEHSDGKLRRPPGQVTTTRKEVKKKKK